jgi:hypothetical protein
VSYGENVHEEVYNGYKIVIDYDQFPQNPRDDDNLGTLIGWHRNYTIGDGKEGFSDNDDFQEWLKKQKVTILPVNMYEHSGVRYSTEPFYGRAQHAAWDSGQVGWIYVTDEDVRKEYSVQRISKKLRERIKGYLKSEVETYDAYASGMVYEYVISDGVDDCIDSCSGMYDGENEYGGAYALKEAKSFIDAMIERGEVAVPIADDDEDDDWDEADEEEVA